MGKSLALVRAFSHSDSHVGTSPISTSLATSYSLPIIDLRMLNDIHI